MVIKKNEQGRLELTDTAKNTIFSGGSGGIIAALILVLAQTHSPEVMCTEKHCDEIERNTRQSIAHTADMLKAEIKDIDKRLRMVEERCARVETNQSSLRHRKFADQ